MSFTPSADPTVNAYIDGLDDAIRPLFVAVREVVLAAEPDLREAIKWRDCLTYSARKNAIQTVVGKGKISLIFFAGAAIDDPKGLLEGDGKAVRTMRITDGRFDKRALRAYVRQAARLAS
jgi:hypothetical protein